MHILIVTSHFEPELVIGADRPTRLAEFLRAKGHQVSVLTKAGPSGNRNESDRGVIRTPWLRLPMPRLVRGTTGDHRVELPIKVFGENSKSTNWVRRLIGRLAHEFFSFPDPEGGWVPFGYHAGKKNFVDSRPDVIFASGPSFSSHIIAARLSNRFEVPWIADYRDLWTSGSYYSYGRARRRFERGIEARILKSAAFATAVGNGLAKNLEDSFSVKAYAIRNGSDEHQRCEVNEKVPLSNSRLNILYVGNNFYAGRRSPKTLFSAAKTLELTSKDICFHFLGSDPNLVYEIAKSEEVSELVKVHSPVGKRESLQWQSRADVLLLLLWNDQGEKDTIPGKLFEYVAVRRPILLSGFSQGEAADIIRDFDLGYCVSNLHDSVEIINNLLAEKITNAVSEDLPESPDLSRNVQFSKLENILVEMVGREFL